LHGIIKYIIMLLMRTTIDIPEDLLRRAKAEASLRGMSLKSWVTEAIRSALEGEGALVRESAPVEYGADQQALDDDCVFPLIRGKGGPALRDLTPERVHEILEEEEVDRAIERPPRSR
jgi:molybdopterin biosynthesis enzyme MoaB